MKSKFRLGERQLSPILRMSIVGIFGGLSFLLTSFAGIPYAGGQGYFSFGDVITILLSLLIGPIEGACIGILGGVFGDLYAGMAYFIPFTIFAKGLLGFLSGFFYRGLFHCSKKGLFSSFLGAIAMIAIYLLSYLILFKQAAWVSFAFDCLQGFASAVLAILLLFPLEKPLNTLLP